MVDGGRVGERAKEALVDGLNGLLNDTSLGMGVFYACVRTCGIVGMEWRVGYLRDLRVGVSGEGS